MGLIYGHVERFYFYSFCRFVDLNMEIDFQGTMLKIIEWVSLELVLWI